MAGELARVKLGSTDIEVSRLGFGSMELMGANTWDFPPVTDSLADTILNGALDQGINFIDTANCYGDSEKWIGKTISNRRSEYYLATKCGCLLKPAGDGTFVPSHEWTRDNLLRNIDESLSRLKTDYVDLMQLHGPPLAECESAGLVDALQEMKKQGKVRYLGMSAMLPDLGTYFQWNVFDVFQIPYSFLNMGHEKIIEDIHKSGKGIIIRGATMKGDPGEGGRGKADSWEKFDKAGLDEFRDEGESRTGFLLRLALSNPHGHTTIVGTLNPDHLLQNIETAKKGPVQENILNEIRKRLSA